VIDFVLAVTFLVKQTVTGSIDRVQVDESFVTEGACRRFFTAQAARLAHRDVMLDHVGTTCEMRDTNARLPSRASIEAAAAAQQAAHNAAEKRGGDAKGLKRR